MKNKKLLIALLPVVIIAIVLVVLYVKKRITDKKEIDTLKALDV